MRLYTIYDRVAGDYGPVLSCKNDQVAVRAFKHALRDVGSWSDYILYYVADFDDGRVRVMSSDPVPVVISGSEEEP